MPSNKKPCVIIVDDSSAIRALFSGALSELNYQIMTFSNPKSALEYIETNEVDCILSDFEMPEMNGLEFCKIVKNSSKRIIPFIVLSMHDSDKTILECLHAGADDFLIKRTNPEIILSKVKLMVEIHLYRENSLKIERLKTFKATVVSLNHEWKNLASFVLPNIEKMEKLEQNNNLDLKKIKNSFLRTIELIDKFGSIDDIKFEDYDADTMTYIIKTQKKSEA